VNRGEVGGWSRRLFSKHRLHAVFYTREMKIAGIGQLSIPFPMPEHVIAGRLQKEIGLTIRMVITDNSSSLLSYRKDARQVVLRMHRMFLSADEGVLSEIVAFIKNRCAATPHIRDFIKARSHLIKSARRQSRSILMQGSAHNLSILFSELNERYFDGALQSTITWSGRAPRCGVKKRNLGSYDRRNDLIRISRYLDRKAVPRYYVAYVVYHEMLHAAVGVVERSGRSIVHSAEFRRRERLFHDYERAIAWERGIPRCGGRV